MKNLALITFSVNYDLVKKVYLLHNDLTKKNYQVQAFISNQSTYKTPTTKNITFVNTPKRPGVNIQTVLRLLSVIKIARYIKKNQIKNVYFESAHIWNYLLTFLLPKNVNIIHVVHDIKPHPGEKNTEGVQAYYKRVFPKVNQFIIHNHKYLNYFSNTYQVDKSQILSTNLWSMKSEFTEITEANTKCLFFGRVNPYKGYYALLDIMKNTEDLDYVLAGRFSEELSEDKKLVNDIKNCEVIDDYITEEKMTELFNDSQIILLPYKSATQSGVVLEAYRYSRPVIAFNVGALGEQIIDKETGLLIEQSNNEEYIKELKKFINLSLKEKNIMAKKANDYYNENMSIDSVSEKIINFIGVSKNV